MDKYIGKMLSGRYEIIDVVGTGGMAIVYRARCHVLNRYVAVKILKEEYAKDPDIRRRFAIESQAVAKLSHHNIVSVYDVGREGDTDYIVMELMEGITLKEYLKKKGHLSYQETLFFAQQIARALMHAHSRGVIHQDIKPQNIIILRDGTAKLTDFGIASFATTQDTRVVQEAIGSVHYISPEQARGSAIDYRTDIYSLGVVMYEMLTGKLPFEGDTALAVVMQHINAVPLLPSEEMPGVPRGMDEIVMHAMCASLPRRYRSAEELCTDLERLKEKPTITFGYESAQEVGREQNIGETQVLSQDVQQAARQTAAAPPRREEAPRREASPVRTTTAVRRRENMTFWEKLSERPGLAAAMAVICFVVIAAIVAGALIITGSNQNEKQKVPNFVGSMVDDVIGNGEFSFFSLSEASQRVESDRPVGEVLEQSVEADTEVVKGTKIVLTVSSGGDHVDNSYKIQDFKGESQDYVTTLLDKRSIVYRLETENSDTVEKGKVTRTDPAAGATLESGATLVVYISQGKAAAKVSVPNLYGQSQSAAEKLLSDNKLTRGAVDIIESTEPEGTVVWQSPSSGTSVEEGTEVNIQVSGGSENPTEPDTPSEPDTPTEPDTPSDPEPSSGTAQIPVTMPPESGDTAHVVISVAGDTVAEGDYSTANGVVTVTVNGPVGTHDVTVSVDGSVSTYTATFN